jgi:hypothetical protein
MLLTSAQLVHTVDVDTVSGFRLPASGFRLPASGFRLLASGFRLPASNFRLLTSGMCYFREGLNHWQYHKVVAKLHFMARSESVLPNFTSWNALCNAMLLASQKK